MYWIAFALHWPSTSSFFPYNVVSTLPLGFVMPYSVMVSLQTHLYFLDLRQDASAHMINTAVRVVCFMGMKIVRLGKL